MNMVKTKKVSQEIVNSCLKLLNEEINFIEGCRELVALRNKFDLEDDPGFLPFVGVASETDDYPSEAARKHFNGNYLNKIDNEVSIYILQVRPSILEACKKLLAKYSP